MVFELNWRRFFKQRKKNKLSKNEGEIKETGELVLESCTSYITDCLSKGIELDSWKLVGSLNDDVVWIENKKLNVRIRTREPSNTVHEYLEVKPFLAPYSSGSMQDTVPPPHKTLHFGNAPYLAEEPSSVTGYFRSEERKAGLTGCDTGSGTY